MLHEFEVKLSAFNVGPNADANNRAGIIAPAPSSAEVLRQIAADVKGDFAFALAGILTRAADELESAQKDAARYRWLRDDRAYAPEEATVRGGEELDALCDEGIDAQHKAG
jgi:hypothetical protein